MRVSITYGEQKSVETQHSEGNKSEKSQINAGGKLNIKTKGGGKESTLTIVGSDVSGKGGTHLKAEGDVNILAVDENHLERSKNKSSGFNAGVAIGHGSSGFAFGVTAGGNVAKGYGNGESQAWVGSQVGSLDSRTTIESGGDANIIGSQTKGKSVKVNAENLNIQSLQDTMKYEGKQESASAQVTVGYGASGSTGYSKSKMKADMTTVNQQAGIFAGDDGYDVDIQNHTELTAGLVTSTEKAEMEGKNSFATGTLNTTNLDNHADYKGSAMSANVAGDYKGGWNRQRVDKEGNPAHSLSNVMGYGSDKDNQSSQTISGINSQNLIIRNEQAQLEKTGKTAEQIREEVKTNTTTDNAESRSGKLENRFDKDKLQKELDYQMKAITDFQAITMATINEKVASHAESKRAEAEQAKAEGNTIKAQELENEAEKWEAGGSYRQGVDAITNAVGLALGGSPTAGVVTGAISPYVNTQIKQATEGNEQANLIAHAIWGAVEAYTQGGKAGAGAVAAVTGEVGASIISQNLFGKKPENLTEAEKRTVSELSQVAAGLASGLSSSGGNSLSIAQATSSGQGIGKNAVENNLLLTDYSNLKGLDKSEREQHRQTIELLKDNGIENIDDYAQLYANCLTEQCQKDSLDKLNQSFDKAYDRIDELAKSGNLTTNDINAIDEYVVRVRSAYDSKRFSEINGDQVYFAGLINILGKNEERLNQARLYATVSNWAKQGYSQEQIENKLSAENLAVILSSASVSLSKQGTSTTKAPIVTKQQISEIIKGTVYVSRSKYPETVSHIEDSIAQGKPAVLTIDRKGAAQRRKEALMDIPSKTGYDRDEYPPAMFKEGGTGASVRYISPKDNRGAGSCIGHQCKQYSDGDKVKIEIKE